MTESELTSLVVGLDYEINDLINMTTINKSYVYQETNQM
ncbi:hypothetical protein BH18THE2_BH18THE2_43580 [soil metagenome]